MNKISSLADKVVGYIIDDFPKDLEKIFLNPFFTKIFDFIDKYSYSSLASRISKKINYISRQIM